MDCDHVTAKLYLQRDNNSYVCSIYNNIIKTALSLYIQNVLAGALRRPTSLSP